MLNSSRFIDERLSTSITSFNPVENPIDQNSPLSFQAWLEYNRNLYSNADDFLDRYQSYLNNWYEVKNYNKELREITTRSLYTTLINEIVLTYTSSDERRWLKNIDFSNNRDLAVAVPFFAQKIKEICLYYSTLRDDTKTAVTRYNLKGSNFGIEKLIYNEISKSLETEDLTDFIRTTGITVSAVRNNMVIDVEDLYDTYTNYLDISNNLPASSYDASSGLRKEYFNLNQYDINSNLFIDFNSAIVQAITSYPFFLVELGNNNFSVNPPVAPADLQYLKDSDFINTVNTQNVDNLNLNLQKQGIQKFIGTDFYYVSTGSTTSDYISGALFTTNNEFANYINKRFPSIAAVPSEEFLKTSKDIGLFFKPDKIGFSNFTNFGLEVTVDRSSLSANTVYIFPDPAKFGNVSGLTEEEFSSPLNIVERNEFNKIDFSNQYRFGDSDTDSYYQIFRAYQSREQTLDTSLQGQAKYTDPQDFFKGDIRSIWSNSDIFPLVPSNAFPIDSRLEKLYSINKTLVQYKNDIYGNEFSLYKDVHPPKIASNERNTDGIDFFLCLTIDGHLFFDPISGFSFDFTTVDLNRGYSGITLKTTTNIPPGTGFYTQGSSFLSPNPLSAQFYNDGIPLFALTGAVLPIVSYRIQPESFCPTRLNLNYLCEVKDGVTFTTKQHIPLPDFSSDDPSYDPNSPGLYYTELIDAGVNSAGPDFRANFVFPGMYTFTPPYSALTRYDSNLFLVNSAAPCGSDLDFVIRYDEQNNYLNYNIPQRDTRVIEGISGLEFKRSIYQTKYLDYGDLYYRNSNSSIILPASAALSGMLIKYSTEIRTELENKLISFDLYYDTLQFETENYLVFDKIQFDYENNSIYNLTNGDSWFERGTNKLLEKISTVWFNENENIVFFCKTVLFNELSATNVKIIYPEIYYLDINSLEYNRIYPLISKDMLTFNELREFSLSGNFINVNIVEIDKPLFSYNEDTGTYSISYLGRDIANVFYVFKVFFKYVDGRITNISNTMFKLATDVDTTNFANALSSEYIGYNILGASVGSITNGVFVFGA